MTDPHDTITELVREAYIDAPQPDFDVQAGLADMHTRIDRAGILDAHVQATGIMQPSATASSESGYGDSAYAGQRQTPTVGVGTVDEPAWRSLSGSERYAACMRGARAGNREALAALVEDLTPLVWHVARGNGLDKVSAEDVVQTVWLALFSHINTLAEPRALAGWLIVTTRREAQRVRARGGTQQRMIDEVAAVIDRDVPDPEEQAVRSDRDSRLWRAFAGLPQRCQELLRLTVLAGRTEYRMVAEAMRMPRGSIGPTRGRCLNTLRELLDTEGGGW